MIYAFTNLVNSSLKQMGWRPKDLVDYFAKAKAQAPEAKYPSHNTVYSICNGRLPHRRLVRVLSAALDITEGSLMAAYESQKAETAKRVEVVYKDKKLGKGEERLLKAYKALPNHRKKQLQEFAAFLSKSVKG